MNTGKPKVEIEARRCTGCGLCAAVCPAGVLTVERGLAQLNGRCPLGCDHCAAVCPAAAIRVAGPEHNALAFATFQQDERWLPPGNPPVSELVRLLRSRRSTRVFRRQPVPRELLADLVKIGITAPSGTNSQRWTFTIIPDRPAMIAFGRLVAAFYRRLNRLAAKGWLRTLLKLVGRRELEDYYRQHYLSIQEALAAWEKDGRDRLFHGAPAAILVGSRPGASCPREDALLATQNILIGAHALGLGTCLIGFAVAALQREAKIGKALGIPPAEKVHAVIALGYPDIVYQRPTGRRPAPIRFWPA